MAIQLSDWYNELAINVAGATVAGMDLALQSTLAEFLRTTGAYSKELPGLTLRANRDTYYIPKQPEGPVLFVRAMFYDRRQLSFIFAEEAPTIERTIGAAPVAFRRYVDDPLRITIYPTPETDLVPKLIPYVALGYSAACHEHVPDFFKLQWYDAILSGAISRLCAQPGKPYTDPQLAMFHGRKFNAQCSIARDQARKQFTVAETPFRFPKWA